MRKGDARPYHPTLIRKVFEDLTERDVAIADIGHLLGITPRTISYWMTTAKLRRGRKTTPEQLDKAVLVAQTYGEDRKLASNKEMYVPEFRPLTAVHKEYIEKGFYETEGKKEVDPEMAVAFGGVVACVDRQISLLEHTADQSDTPQEVSKALVAAIALKQLREVFVDPPTVNSWNDVEKIVNMLRNAMDITNNSGQKTIGVDVNILSFNPAEKTKKSRGKVIDAETMNVAVEG